METEQCLIETKDLVKDFSLGRGKKLRAVNKVNIHINKGETLGLVGESGSGKSTLGRLIMRLLDADEGSILVMGTDISPLRGKKLEPFRSRMQMILQDPYSSLNPVMRIGEIIAEPLRLRQNLSSSAVREAVGEMLRQVGLSPDDYNRFPQEFSGGQRQRVGIARALIVRPAFVLCDEPISALDVSIQAQVVNLLEDMRAEYQPAYLFVAHDLSMVRHISDRIAVMYRGEVLETAGAAEVYEHPRHPYTQALLSAVPIPNPEKSRQKLAALEASASAQESEGEAESRSRGCAFVQRCPYAKQRCREEKPQLEGSAADTGHQSACFL